MNIREFLTLGKPLLFDGAMGTCYASRPGHDSLHRRLVSHDSFPAGVFDDPDYGGN